MLKKLLALSILFYLPFIVLSQDKIDTDRPTETQNASLVPKGTFQAEIGFRKQHEEGKQYFYRYPNAVLRYGLFNFLELRVEPMLETQKMAGPAKSKHGLAPLEAGIKAKIFQTKDTAFILSFNGHLGIPHAAAKDYEQDKVFYRARLLLQNKITDKIKVNYNIGRDWDTEDREQNWMYSISPQFELGDKWTLLLEEYANFVPNGAAEHYADIGVAFGVTKSLQLDVNGGIGLNKHADDYFITGGISFKF